MRKSRKGDVHGELRLASEQLAMGIEVLSALRNGDFQKAAVVSDGSVTRPRPVVGADVPRLDVVGKVRIETPEAQP
ncbi:MAG TPA: hypothetical protein VF580_03050, partial [Thermoanaerobaculia bacterium]